MSSNRRADAGVDCRGWAATSRRPAQPVSQSHPIDPQTAQTRSGTQLDAGTSMRRMRLGRRRAREVGVPRRSGRTAGDRAAGGATAVPFRLPPTSSHLDTTSTANPHKHPETGDACPRSATFGSKGFYTMSRLHESVELLAFDPLAVEVHEGMSRMSRAPVHGTRAERGRSRRRSGSPKQRPM
jgi:hypothetical protein